jgi:hypothetical protein
MRFAQAKPCRPFARIGAIVIYQGPVGVVRVQPELRNRVGADFAEVVALRQQIAA